MAVIMGTMVILDITDTVTAIMDTMVMTGIMDMVIMVIVGIRIIHVIIMGIRVIIRHINTTQGLIIMPLYTAMIAGIPITNTWEQTAGRGIFSHKARLDLPLPFLLEKQNIIQRPGSPRLGMH